MPNPRLRRIVTAALFAFAAAPAAQAQLCATGQAYAGAFTGQSQNVVYDSHAIGDPEACHSGSVFTQTVASTERVDLYPGDPAAGRQASDASLFAYATYGGLRGSASAQSSVANVLNNVTGASAQMYVTWNDSITFHTDNPLGADFTFSMTLDDGIGTILSPGYVRNSSAAADAISYFYFGGGDPLLSVVDSQNLYVPTSGPAEPILSSNLAGAHTVSRVVHVYDGQTALINQTLYVSAGVQANGSSFADAAHTAYFDLATSDASASYVTGSGTVFATAGNPFAVAPVPEPSDFALIAAGLGVLVGVGRRRQRAQT